MPGRHSAPDRSRLHREIIRYVIILAVLAVVLVGGAVLLSGLLSESGGTTLTTVALAETTTSVLPETISTQSTTTTTTTMPTTTTTTEPTTTTTTLPPVREPGEITVLVLNSTSTVGMAGRLSSSLGDLGYQMLDADNYSPQLNISRVWYAEGFDREAGLLAAEIPDAIVEERPEGDFGESDITVVLGASFEE